jgi:hypothetical protein
LTVWQIRVILAPGSGSEGSFNYKYAGVV